MDGNMYRYRLMVKNFFFFIPNKIKEVRESARIEAMLDEALIDETLIYRMWATEHGSDFDKAVMQFHESVQSFSKAVDAYVKSESFQRNAKQIVDVVKRIS